MVDKAEKMRQIGIIVSLGVPIVRIKSDKVQAKDGFRRVPAEKWKDVIHIDRVPEELWGKEIAVKCGFPMVPNAIGEQRRLYIVDVDLKKQKGIDSFEELKKEMPDAWGGPCYRTESGGLHFWFSADESDIFTPNLDIYPGIDFLGLGSLSFEPPSQFFEGTKARDAYRWLVEPNGPDSIPPLPKEIAKICKLRMIAAQEKLRQEEARLADTSESDSIAVGRELEFFASVLAHHRPQQGLEYWPWLRVGMALHHTTQGADEAFEVWDAWGAAVQAKAGLTYDHKKTKISWDSFSASGSGRGAIIRLGTLIWHLMKDLDCSDYINDVSQDFCIFGEEINGQNRTESYSLEHTITLPSGLIVNAATVPPKLDPEMGNLEKNINDFSEFEAKLDPISGTESAALGQNAHQTASDLPKNGTKGDAGTLKTKTEVSRVKKVQDSVEKDSSVKYLRQDALENAVLQSIGSPRIRRNEANGALEITTDAIEFIEKNKPVAFTDSLIDYVVMICRDVGKYSKIIPLMKGTDVVKILGIIGQKNRYHPINEYLQDALSMYKRDKTERILRGEPFSPTYYRDELFARLDWEDKKDQKWFEECIDFWMVGAICKVLYGYTNAMLILKGNQGTGKSTLAKALCKDIGYKYYYAGEINPIDKDHKAKLAATFVWEADELSKSMRNTLDRVKSFLTLTTVTERLPYDRCPTTMKSVTNFIGTANDDFFLRDITGARRMIVANFKQEDVQAWVDYLYSPDFNPTLLWGEFMERVESQKITIPLPTKAFAEEMRARAEGSRLRSDLEHFLEDYFELGTDDDFVTRNELRDLLEQHSSVREKNFVPTANDIFKAWAGKDISGWNRSGLAAHRGWRGIKRSKPNPPTM